MSPGDVDRVAQLERDLKRMGLRLEVTRLVSRDTSRLIDDDAECVDLVVDDVLRCWQDGDPDQQRAQMDGPNGFWNWYASRVEFAPSGSADEYRAEFCTPETDLDFDLYYAAVWRAHLLGRRKKQHQRA